LRGVRDGLEELHGIRQTQLDRPLVAHLVLPRSAAERAEVLRELGDPAAHRQRVEDAATSSLDPVSSRAGVVTSPPRIRSRTMRSGSAGPQTSELIHTPPGTVWSAIADAKARSDGIPSP
jgi:hypothetical protein